MQDNDKKAPFTVTAIFWILLFAFFAYGSFINEAMKSSMLVYHRVATMTIFAIGSYYIASWVSARLAHLMERE